MLPPTIHSEIKEIVPKYIDFKDTIPNDTLLIHLDEDGIPVKYSREIITGVCIDGECRLVRIDLFWNITGRYLGFELPPGEFLSKTEHVHFTPQEYDRLHELLTDRNSALANYSLDELVPQKDSSSQKVDAVSSATIAAVLDYIVKGAVYTTYTLWHIVYGPAKREIEKLSTEILNPEIILKILKSEQLDDKIWVLNHMSDNIELNPELLAEIMELISGKDVYLAERALHALKKEALNFEVQNELVKVFMNSGFLQKRLIIQKLKEAEKLNPEVTGLFSQNISQFNGILVKNTLEMFNYHQVEDETLNAQVAALLAHENRYIAAQAFRFLDSANVTNRKTQKQIEKYRRKSQ